MLVKEMRPHVMGWYQLGNGSPGVSWGVSRQLTNSGGPKSAHRPSAPVRTHFRRVALTRAKARALRDALGIDLVAVEELADSE